MGEVVKMRRAASPKEKLPPRRLKMRRAASPREKLPFAWSAASVAAHEAFIGDWKLPIMLREGRHRPPC
jgi:hypothetical protein